jgi:anti-sigma factor RsiW
MTGHEEWQELSAYIDDALSPEERSRLDAHLPGCEDCRLELAALRYTKKRLAATPRRAFPPELLSDMEQRWDAGVWRSNLWAGVLRPNSYRRWVPAGAIAVAALILGLWMKLHHAEDELPIELLAAAHSRYSAEGLIPGDMVASNFSAELEQMHHHEHDD